MRVTGGTLRGRHIEVPKQGTRPTQDRVREALFSILGDRVPGSSFLDLFAGSGAVGLDAWSRGAETVCWIESDAKHGALLKNNVKTLCGDDRPVILGDVFRELEKGIDGSPFDLVFADPPYADDCIERLVDATRDTHLLADDGLLVVERDEEWGEFTREGWSLSAAKRYGKTHLYFLRHAP
jgi:16S rRNA (guanine(966)-N(2))-methyltransferase RsmD